MSKKLYRVEIEPEPFDMFVWAEDPKEAKKLASHHADDAHDNVGPDFYCTVRGSIDNIDDVPEEYRETLPYGEEDHTIEELFSLPKQTT